MQNKIEFAPEIKFKLYYLRNFSIILNISGKRVFSEIQKSQT